MATCKINGIEVPRVSNITPGYQFLGDRSRTAQGKLRQDAGAKGWMRTWIVETTYLTQAEISAVLSPLQSFNFAECEVWLAEFGAETNTVTCLIPPENIRFDNLPEIGYPNRRRIILEIIEKG